MTRGYLLGTIGFSLVLGAACGASGTDGEVVGDPPVSRGGTTSKGGSGGKVSGGSGGAAGKAGGAAGKSQIAGTGGSGGSGGAAGAKAGGAAGGAGAGGGAAGKAGSGGSAGSAGSTGSGGQPMCTAGRGDCNGKTADGCETDLTNTLADCGACGEACPAAGPSSNVSCQGGKCVSQCFLATGDCDGNKVNGCETNTNTDVLHCGSCDAKPCAAGEHGKAACDGGSCAFACDAGFGDCDQKLETGCEVTFASNPAHCGACGTNCGEAATCKAGKCECAASTSVAELIPVDLHLLLDKSGSMNDPVECTFVIFCSSETKWTETTGALKSFISSTTAADKIGMGVTFFPQGNGDGECNVGQYAKPKVETADLPGAAGALIGAIDGTSPGGNTPSRPAVQGAMDHATAFQTANPGRKSVLVFATDGEPTGCAPNDIGDVSAAIAGGKTKGINTYVIGVFATDTFFGGGGSAKDSLNQWASAGGTDKAFLVNVSKNLSAEFKAALDTIRKTAIGCEYNVPKPTGGQAFDPEKVNVLYTPGGGAEKTLVNVPNEAACKPDAWYYDNPKTPSKILLCPSICPTVKNDPAGKVQVSVGCGTRKD